jgi:hypothetical protein
MSSFHRQSRQHVFSTFFGIPMSATPQHLMHTELTAARRDRRRVSPKLAASLNRGSDQRGDFADRVHLGPALLQVSENPGYGFRSGLPLIPRRPRRVEDEDFVDHCGGVGDDIAW